MADDQSQALPSEVVEPIATDAPKKGARAKKVAQVAPAKPKSRGLSAAEKQEKVAAIDAHVAGGATLKDAVKSEGISDQTYYQWKKGIAQPTTEVVEIDDELSEFIRLEEENRSLRRQLSEKLRAENADLRKRLGLK